MFRFRVPHIKGFSCIAAILLTAGGPTFATPITGTVLGPDDKPVAGAQVSAQTWVGHRGTVELQTDAGGKFTFDATFTDPTEAVARIVVIAPHLAVGGGMAHGQNNVFHLERAGQVTGQVVDNKGQPVAGARIRLNGIDPKNDQDYAKAVWLDSDTLRDKFSSNTDANGRWTIQGVPASGKAYVELTDPAYVSAQQQVPLNPEIPPLPLVVRPGATLTGRITFEDGKPAPGIRIFAQSQRSGEGWAEGKSDAAGAYALSGLLADSYNILVDAGQKFKDLVAPALEGVPAQEGKTLKLADLTLDSGALVEGTVVDAATNKPLPDIEVASYGPHRPRSSAAVTNTVTDAQGHYELRVAPGKSLVYLMGVPEGYLRPEGTNEETPNVELAKGQTKTLSFRLNQGLTAMGNAVDATGKPVSGIRISFTGQETRLTDANGQWRVVGLKPAEYQITADAEWQVVTPATITLPSFAPIKVTLRRITLVPLQARVVDTTGKPVVGALIKATIETPVTLDGGTAHTEELFSDMTGRAGLTKLRLDEKVTLVTEKAGYKYVGGGAVTKKDAAWVVSDIVLMPLTAKREGLVLDALGKPVAGAQVLAPEGGRAAHTETDANGRFTLSDLPPGAVTIMAAQGSGFAQLRASTAAAPVTLALAPWQPATPQDIPRATAIVKEALQQSEGKDYYAREWLPLALAPYAPAVTLQLQPRSNVPMLHDTAAEEKKIQLMRALAEANPTLAGDWIPGQIDTLQSVSNKLTAAIMVGLAVVHTRPALAWQMLTRAEAWAAQIAAHPPAEPDDQDFMGLLTQVDLAALEAQFQDPTAMQRVGIVLKVARNAYTETTHPTLGDILIGLATSAAPGSPALVEQVTEHMTPASRVDALCHAVPIVAQYDAAGALRLLNEIAGIQVTEDEKQVPGGGHWLNREPEYAFGIAAKPVIAALGVTDPAAALALARRVKSRYHVAMALALAAQAQPKAVAGPLFQEAFVKAGNGHESIAIRIAAMAFAVDPDVGRKLFADLKGRVANEPRSQFDVDPKPEFAFYYAQVEPAASRLMLETDYARLLQQGTTGWGLEKVTLAMAAVDIDRALEMARSIPGSNNGARFDTQRKIAQYVVAPAAVRATMPFDRWGASDTWTPGTDTGW